MSAVPFYVNKHWIYGPRHFSGPYRYSITNNPANGWKEYY